LPASPTVGGCNEGLAGHSIVPLAPWPVIVGAVVSTTVMVWLTEFDRMWQLSFAVARHVLVTVYLPAQLPGVVTSLNVSVAAQLFVTVGGVKVGVVVQSTVALEPAAPRI